MGLGQFNEIYPLVDQVTVDSTYTPGTATPVGAETGPQKRYDAVLVSNSDTVAHDMTIAVVQGASTVVQGTISIPARSGYDGNFMASVFAILYPAAYQQLVFPANGYLSFSLAVAPGAGTTVTLFGLGGLL